MAAFADFPLMTWAQCAHGRFGDHHGEHLVPLQVGFEGASGIEHGRWVASPNWVADALTRPMVAVYSAGSTHVLGAALVDAGGRSLLGKISRRREGA